ncbi:unnamed protein product [Cylindrotheca closterium]|uniref:DUF6824 domain-containing protein n=1 Tax=Cylindrotheca closterium TaxID=2856 RepID=A0AAD2FU74_9STRA|nr:unnamed protein product [Cylindrotheca closterium]
MEVLKVQQVKLTPDNGAIATARKIEKAKEPTEAPAVAEFLLALAHSHPDGSDSPSSNARKASTAPKTTVSTPPTATVTTNMTKKLGGKIVNRPNGAPVRARPLPEYLTLTRIPPLLFAEKLLRHENVPLEHYFPDQFDVEVANYQPSDHDIICGRGRGNFSHIGNQKLLDIIRERQDDYLKSNKRGKGALGKQILLEILMNGGRFIKLKDKDQQVWRVLSHKDVNTKIMHCIRDQINFQRKQTLAPAAGDEETKGTKNTLDASSFPPAKRMKSGAKKLSSYLKMKYNDGDDQEGGDKSVPITPKEKADRALSQASSFAADLQGLQAPRVGAADRSLAEAMLARSQAEKAETKSSELAGARMDASRFEEGDDMASLLAHQKHAFSMGSGMQPGLHNLIAKKEAELAALRAAMMGDSGMGGMMSYSSLMPQLGPSALDRHNMILARAELAAHGLRDPLADRLRLANMMNQDAMMADHLRQVAMQRGGMAGHPLASLFGGLSSQSQHLPDVHSGAGISSSEGDAAASATSTGPKEATTCSTI